MSTHGVELTLNESLYLDDALSMHSPGPPDGDRPFPELLLKIGAAVLELSHEQRATVTVHFTYPELWVMREVAKASVTVGPERVGLMLKKKVHQGLRALSAETAVKSATAEFGSGEGKEPTKAEYQGRLEQWRKEEDGNAGHEDDPRHDAGGGAGPGTGAPL